MKLNEATVKELKAEIRKFQAAQRRAHAEGAMQLADEIGSKFLAPLFKEMARRQSKGEL